MIPVTAVGVIAWVLLQPLAAHAQVAPEPTLEVPAPVDPSVDELVVGARAAFTAGEHDEAAVLYRRAALRRPSPELWSGLGAAHLAAGRPREAVLAYHRALALAPRSARQHASLAVALASDGSMGDARRRYALALRIDPDLADARLGLALVEVGWRPSELVRWSARARDELLAQVLEVGALSQTATTLYGLGGVTLAVGALTALPLLWIGVRDALGCVAEELGGRPCSTPGGTGLLVAGFVMLAVGAVGLVLSSIGIGFDVASATARDRWRARIRAGPRPAERATAP